MEQNSGELPVNPTYS